ncbi:MAG: hypothetical protein GX070_04540 [Alcaligenaceae bacterium]|nr:hypothetical protein [Alcaligenaceae bacterium]
MKAHFPYFRLAILPAFLFCISSSYVYAEQVYCQSPWLKNNGKIGGSINGGKGSFTIDIKQVNQAAGNSCSADLHIRANAPIAGQQINGSGNFRLLVNNSGSVLSGSFESAGLLGTIMQSVISSNVNGYFLKPANIINEQAASLPSQTYKADVQASVSLPSSIPISQVKVDNAFLQSAARTIGKAQPLKTQMGTFSCVPVNYTGTLSSGQILSGLPPVNKTPRKKQINVTEWYCPEKGLTMKMDIKSGSSLYSVAITYLN